MDAYRSLVGEFGDVADFVMIYIEEAHPSDGWLTPTMTPHVIHSHRSLTERMRAARLLDATYDVPGHFVLDGMEDEACRAYGALYERLCVVLNGRVAYLGGRGPWYYSVAEVRQWLHRGHRTPGWRI